VLNRAQRSDKGGLMAQVPMPTAEELARDEESRAEELHKLLQLLPPRVRDALEKVDSISDLVEVVMDLGRVPLARFPSVGDVPLGDEEVSRADLDDAVQLAGQFGGDNRAGVDRTLHRISCMRNRQGKIVGLTMRVGRSVWGSAAMGRDLVESGQSLLLLGPPGVGKTTAIREIARMLADEYGKRVVIVDTSNEIGGDGDVPHPGVGSARRMQVPAPELQHQVMIEAVENHMPQVIVIDEIGTELEALAARTIAQRGVQLVGTCHGQVLENVLKNPSLSDLVGGITSVTLGDEEAKRRGVQKSILEREAPPTFDVAIEMVARQKWRIVADVAEAVDSLLSGQGGKMTIAVRELDRGTGQIRVASSPLDEGATWANTAVATDEREREVPGTTHLRGSPRGPAAGAGGGAEASGAPPLGPGGAPSKVLRVYPFSIDEDVVQEVVENNARVVGGVRLAARIEQADVVLALRTKVKQNSWVRATARELGIPVYAVKSTSPGAIFKALRALLGLEPTAGLAPLGTTDLGDELPAAEGPPPDGEEAAEEARLAVENIVLPMGQIVELQPRSPGALALQIQVVEGYSLDWAYVGESPNTRLRVSPKE